MTRTDSSRMSREPVSKWFVVKFSTIAVTGIAAIMLTIIAFARQP
ncbi:hypothetical protein [Herbiconiux ginsengi]|uniref:Uncharacterized protein n=1 Tax=Herbiconiux ginsengi TaxID=381665 RepID=A0A1H3MNN7_9MICO|nr:hypothetical protein [Herbiconiux ginsengi]SDY78196.1 hypothetical protein SAMN05216554_1500 [Herbiconiux ginsengi]